ncbi:MAG: hypothetical protein R3B84_06465 [Zavarzinella sp.]
MADNIHERLHAYLDEALQPNEMAAVEAELRENPELRDTLKLVLDQWKKGEHSLGGIWRKERLSCISRDDLNNYLRGLHDPDFADYIQFHLEVVVCQFCLANYDDLIQMQQNDVQAISRRKRLFEASEGYVKKSRPIKDGEN